MKAYKISYKHIKPGNIFLDIGAHFGFYSLLAADLVGPGGSVCSFESSPQNFLILKQNAGDISQLKIFNQAVSVNNGAVTMHEFSTAYSEYNSIYAGQFDKENWFRKNSWRETTVVAVTLDDFCSRENITPCMIKIDVEGSEFDVVYGGGNLLLEMKTGFIVM
ncbi:MAG: hypothetical protein C4308_00860 [Chitinophagaceae bacterium]